MKIIIFDTETTGLPDPNSPLEKQPYICQFSACIVEIDLNTKEFKEIEQVNQYLKPEVLIPYECTRIHGITNEMVQDKQSFKEYANELITLFQKCDVAIAHNLNFDQTIIENELRRIGRSKSFLPEQTFDTMDETKELLKLPGRFSRYKSPNLGELHFYLTGETFANAHNALNDVMALTRCVKELFRRDIFKPEEKDQSSLF